MSNEVPIKVKAKNEAITYMKDLQGKVPKKKLK